MTTSRRDATVNSEGAAAGTRGRDASVPGAEAGGESSAVASALALRIAVVLGLGLAVTQTYRAATQSITHDEALTYLRYLSQPWETVFSSYSANHHLLFTYVSKLSVDVFGPSELSLRLPSLLAFLLFALSVGALTRRMAPSRPLFLASFAFLLLNPLLLDFLCAGRGYGMALGFFAWALALGQGALSRAVPVSARGRLAIGAALALCVSSNLAFAPAALGVGVALLLIDNTSAPGGGMRRLGLTLRAWVLTGLLPGLAITGALVALPLRFAQRAHFFYGAPTLSASVRGLVEASLDHGGVVTPDGADPSAFVAAIADVLCPLLLLLIIASALQSWRRRGPGLPLFFAVSLAVSLLAVVALHVLADAAYPRGRTGLYLIPLFALAALEALRPARSLARGALLALLLAASAVFVAGFELSYFRSWRYDAGAKQVAAQILETPGPRGEGGVRVALLDWRYQPALSFYRQLAPPGAMAELSREWELGDFSYDVYVVHPKFPPELVRQYLTPVFEHPLSGVVLATGR
ncbi:MAG: hypothetical protein DRQ55_11895 [Planctomycetota bacterium]|nr:MAG: hypothetical protein DRQ55_11895 [Planctomycetota bacterium]